MLNVSVCLAVAATQAQDQVESGLLLDVVIGQSAAILARQGRSQDCTDVAGAKAWSTFQPFVSVGNGKFSDFFAGTQGIKEMFEKLRFSTPSVVLGFQA